MNMEVMMQSSGRPGQPFFARDTVMAGNSRLRAPVARLAAAARASPLSRSSRSAQAVQVRRRHHPRPRPSAPTPHPPRLTTPLRRSPTHAPTPSCQLFVRDFAAAPPSARTAGGSPDMRVVDVSSIVRIDGASPFAAAAASAAASAKGRAAAAAKLAIAAGPPNKTAIRPIFHPLNATSKHLSL